MVADIFRGFGFIPVARNETWVRTGPDAASIALTGVLAATQMTRTLVLSIVFRRDASAPGGPARPSAS